MEQLPGYDSWKTRAPEDEDDLRRRRGDVTIRGKTINIGGDLVGGTKDDGLTRDLVTILRVITDHACETYPHFESARGQDEIRLAREVLKRAEEVGYA